QQGRVRPRALLLPFRQQLADVEHTAAVIAGDHSCYSLQEKGLIALRFFAGKISQGVCVWIDKAGGHNQPVGIDRARGFEACLARVADKDDSIAANSHISFAWFPARTIDESSVQDQQVELLRLNRCRPSVR